MCVVFFFFLTLNKTYKCACVNEKIISYKVMHTFLGTSNTKYELMFVFLNMFTLQWSKNYNKTNNNNNRNSSWGKK